LLTPISNTLFANFGLFRESLSREKFANFQFAKVYPVNSEVFSTNDFHFFRNLI